MTERRWAVFWTREALKLIRTVKRKPLRRSIVDEADALETQPTLGKELQGELAGYRSLRVARERYRLLYRVAESERSVYIVYIGRRTPGRAEDVYELARKLLQAGLLRSR